MQLGKGVGQPARAAVQAARVLAAAGVFDVGAEVRDQRGAHRAR